ncbi:MAG: hypothetical protein ACOY42_02005 [Pseudomonadota bacterium]
MAEPMKLGISIELEGGEAFIRDANGARVAIGGLGTETDKSSESQRRGTEAARQQQSAFSALGAQARQLTVLLGALGGVSLARQLFEVNAAAQASQAALRTLTGSVGEAAVVWERLLDFAAQTPFNFEQSIDAFRALKARGLDPSIEALSAYADFAAAMGRDLTQFVEAVADAATGEMERLKEFGVIAAQQGDQISFTFKGVTTVVQKNAQAIEQYLQGIARTNFAGAAAAQMDTLSGQASNLGDNISKLAMALGEAGANRAFATLLAGLSSGVETLAAHADELLSGLTVLATALGGRLVASLAASAAQMLATAGAAGILQAALALLGGPAGVIGLAIGGLIGYIATLETTAEKTQRLAGETEKLSLGMDKLSRLQAENRLNQVNAKIQETTDALVAQGRLIETYQGLVDEPNTGVRGADLTAARAAEEDLQRVLRDQFQTRKDLLAVVNGTYQAQRAAAEQSAAGEQSNAAAIAATVAAQKNRLAVSQAELAAMQHGEAAHQQFLIQREAEKILAEHLKALGVDNIAQLGAEGESLRQTALAIAQSEAAVTSYGRSAKQGYDQAAKAAEQHRQELQRIVDAANPLAARQRDLIAQIAMLDQAIARETGDTRAMVQAKQALERQLTALRAPMVAITDAHAKTLAALQAELTALRGGADAYDSYLSQKRIEETAQQRINALLADGHELRQQDRTAIYEQARAEEQLRGQIEAEKGAREEANRAWDAFVTEIVGAFLDSADSIGDVWADLLGRLKREVLNFGAGALLGLSPSSTPILSGIGQVLGIGGGKGGTGATGGTSGGASSALSALFSGGQLFPGLEAKVTGMLTQLELQGGAVGAVATELANATASIAELPGGLVGGGLISAGAGWAGGQLGQMAFGEAGTVSQLGGIGGGLAGAAFAPVALGALGGPLGALAGSFIGSALDSVFAGDGPETRAAIFAGGDASRAERKWTVADITGASGLRLAGEAQRVGEQGSDAVKALTDQFAAIDKALTDLTRGAGLQVDLSQAAGFGGGQFGISADSAKDFVRAWIDAVSAPFDAELKDAAGALVGDTAEDLINAYQGLLTVREDLRSGGGLFEGLGSLSEISAAVSPAEIQRVSAFGAQLRSLQRSLDTDAMAAWEQSQRSVFALWREQGDAIVGAAELAVTELDFTALAVAVQDRYQTELQLIGQIMGALESSAARFSATYESIFIDGLKTEEERYNYFRDQADALAETITTLNDPGEIAAAAERYDALLKQAYQALGEGSRDAMRGEILHAIDEMQSLVQDKLQSALDAVQADGDTGTPGSVANAIQGATEAAIEQLRDTMAESIRAMADQQQAAASAQQRAADQQFAASNQFAAWVSRLPSTIRVNVSTGSEVAL